MMQVYVGTYEKYNNGSISGKWLPIELFEDSANFYEVCKGLHSDELDPELMFQDWEGIPDGLIGESYINPIVFDLPKLCKENFVNIHDVINYIETIGINDMNQFTTANELIELYQEAICGSFESMKDFAYEYREDTHGSCCQECESYFDWDSYARDLENDFIMSKNGNVYRR